MRKSNVITMLVIDVIIAILLGILSIYHLGIVTFAWYALLVSITIIARQTFHMIVKFFKVTPSGQSGKGISKEDYSIPPETLEWLESVSVLWYPEPWICGVPFITGCGCRDHMHYSAEYLKNTPLDEIKQGWAKHMKWFSPPDES